MRVVLLGSLGSGKTTQAEILSARSGAPVISMSGLLRRAAAGGPHAAAIRSAMDAGELVGEDIVLPIFERRLHEHDVEEHGFILDGFPRRPHQGDTLRELIRPASIDAAILLDVPEKIRVHRISSRVVCSQCGHPESLDKHMTVCPLCGGELVSRTDDRGPAAARRQSVFDEETTPLRTYYEKEGQLIVLEGSKPIEAVANAIRETLRL